MYDLGYKPKKEKKKSVSYAFVNSKVKNSILRFTSEHGTPILKLKFFASVDYSDLFHEAIRRTIEEFNYKYTGCFRCGRCGVNVEGYKYSYKDGREFFRCGYELIDIPVFTKENVSEITKLLQSQHEYYLTKN